MAGSLVPLKRALTSERFYAVLAALGGIVAAAWVGAVAAARWMEAREHEAQVIAALELGQAAARVPPPTWTVLERDTRFALERCHNAELVSIATAREVAAQWARARARPGRRDGAAAQARVQFDNLLRDHPVGDALRLAIESGEP
jgi:predicted nicotinamide N-methyase